MSKSSSHAIEAPGTAAPTLNHNLSTNIVTWESLSHDYMKTILISGLVDQKIEL